MRWGRRVNVGCVLGKFCLECVFEGVLWWSFILDALFGCLGFSFGCLRCVFDVFSMCFEMLRMLLNVLRCFAFC